MTLLISILLLLSSFLSVTPQTPTTTTANIYYSKTTGKYTVTEGPLDPSAVASITYTTSYETTGWDYLTLSSYQGTDNKYPDYIKSYAMGYLEGVITSKRIYPFYLNMRSYHFHKHPNTSMPSITKQFLIENMEYMKQKALQYRTTDPYWDQVYNFYKQMTGLIDGYNSVAPLHEQINHIEFQVLNAVSDVDEMEYWKNPSARPNYESMTTQEIIDYVETHTHCSALIKIAADYSDIWFGHDTWTSYNKMNRIFKEYKYKTNTNVEASQVVAFSGFPGILASIDDFYITDNDLYITETTNSVFNTTIYDELTPKCLLSWIRTLVANRMAHTGKEWAEIFVKENSGTYNNQFDILDMKLINLTSKTIEQGALYIVEQLPGFYDMADVTHVLKRGYFPSYNIPYFDSTRRRAGYYEKIAGDPTLKDSYDYHTCIRANMFRRDQGKVVDMQSFKKLMRYNDYLNDPLTKGNPSNSIACRRDLLEKEGTARMCFGDIDSKVASINEVKGVKNKKIHIIAGPPNENVETFDWRTTKCRMDNPVRWTYYGQVEKYDFDWVEYNTQLF